MIYGLLDPRDGVVKYVGRTVNLKFRMMGHLNRGVEVPSPRRNWILELRSLGLAPKPIVFEECSRDVSDVREAHWIQVHAGPALLNQHAFSTLRAGETTLMPRRPAYNPKPKERP